MLHNNNDNDSNYNDDDDNDEKSYIEEARNVCMNMMLQQVKNIDSNLNGVSVTDTSGYDGVTIEGSYYDRESGKLPSDHPVEYKLPAVIIFPKKI